MNERKHARLQGHRNGTNKENLIKRVQSEMVFSKRAALVCQEKERDAEPAWCQSHRLWSNMMRKTQDKTYQSHANFLDAHPSISTKMRSVLFDWLIEVCEVYHLHRETYHLSIAYIDGYLCQKKNVPKNKFQLLGITALFVAAKIEEIYPPRISDFSYVTDNTCGEDDILDMELDLMTTLHWHISPVTAISWLLICLQAEHDVDKLTNTEPAWTKRKLASSDILRSSILSTAHRSKDFVQTFSSAVRLLDLCSLDMEYSQFSKHILAASAVLLCKTNWPIEKITGLTTDDICVCQEWMKPFSEALIASPAKASTRAAPETPADEVYAIQVHNVSIDLLNNVYEKRPTFVPPARPFRDLLNQLSWLPTLAEAQHDGKEVAVIV